MGRVPEDSCINHRHGGKCRTLPAPEPVSALLARAGSAQHGVVARWQLLRRGLTTREIEGLVGRGHLQPLHGGVYAVGHRLLTQRGWWMAAVLACGSGGVLSHRSAVQAHGLLWSSEIDVEVTRPHSFRPQQGIRFHQAALLPDEVTVVQGIPVTTAFRAAFDVAGLGERRLVERVVHEIKRLRLAEAVSFDELLRRHPRKHGAGLLCEVLDSKAPVGVTRNQFEEAFVAFVDEYALPRPAMNAPLVLRERSFEIDALWRPQRLAVELDSREVHDTDDGFESDRERDRVLLTEGWRTTRITWRQLRDSPTEIAADLHLLLTA